MKPRRATPLTETLLQGTVLSDWFAPMQQAFEKVRYSERPFLALPMVGFALLGGVRQLLSIETLREQVQHLFHVDPQAKQVPVARSTWSDAMGSRQRRDILHQAVAALVASAPGALPDKLKGSEGIGQRPVLAIDATYQQESSHYNRVLPREGGGDNQKGHMLLTYYNLRCGIPCPCQNRNRLHGRDAGAESRCGWKRRLESNPPSYLCGGPGFY